MEATDLTPTRPNSSWGAIISILLILATAAIAEPVWITRDGTTKRHYPLIMARLQEFISARIMVWKLMHGGVFRFENTPVSEEYAWTLGEGEETIQIEAEEAALDLQSAHAALV